MPRSIDLSLRHGAVAAALMAALAAPVGAQPAAVAAPVEGLLQISASAQRDVVRDLVSITFSTTREGPDARTVQAELQRALDAALQVARAAARPGQIDVQTGTFSLSPRHPPQAPSRTPAAPTITGWVGTVELVVEGRDIAGIGALVPRIATLTVARTGQRLSREAAAAVEGELVAEAVARFRAKADAYARLFGYAGAAVREVSVTTFEPGPGPLAMMRMQAAPASPAGDALSVEVGKTAVSAQVSGTVQMR